VPRDVAVEKPGTGVVGVEGDHEPAEAGKHGDVATGWVVEVQGLAVVGGDEGSWCIAGAEGAGEESGFAENEEIVALCLG